MFAFGVTQWAALAQSGAVHGFKVVAVAIVAQAVSGIGKTLCPDRLRVGIAMPALAAVYGCVHTMLRDGERHFKTGSRRAYVIARVTQHNAPFCRSRPKLFERRSYELGADNLALTRRKHGDGAEPEPPVDVSQIVCSPPKVQLELLGCS